MQAKGTSPRRTRVEGERGIWKRLDRDGREVFDVSYYDGDGRRRMERVHGKLRDAIALREKLRTEARGGESKPRKTTLTFEQVALEWFEQIELRDRTREWYDVALRVHLLPRLGRRRVSSITAEDVERLIREMKRADRGEGKVGYAAWTIRGVVGVLGGVLGYAARRRLIVRDPMDDFRAEEKRRGRGRVLPKGASRQRVLSREELVGLLDEARPLYRALLATAAFAGLRLGELLALKWADVDLAGESIHVGRQLDRRGRLAELKTVRATRDVDVPPFLVAILREHRAASPYSRPDDFVFAGEVGTPLSHRNVERRGLDRAAVAAGLNAGNRPKLRVHDLRHCCASMLIAGGADVVYVSRQLGHSSPDITLRVYADEFGKAQSAARSKAALEARFATILQPNGGGERRKRAAAAGRNVAQLADFRTGGG